MATLLKATGETQLVTPANGAHFTLAELQGFVGGYIEMVRTPGQRFLILNEEGKFDATLQRNAKATEIARSAGIMPGDFVMGDVLWVGPNELED